MLRATTETNILYDLYIVIVILDSFCEFQDAKIIANIKVMLSKLHFAQPDPFSTAGRVISATC